MVSRKRDTSQYRIFQSSGYHITYASSFLVILDEIRLRFIRLMIARFPASCIIYLLDKYPIYFHAVFYSVIKTCVFDSKLVKIKKL